jgi:hypothetical protein
MYFQVQGVPLATEPGISLMSCQQQFLEKYGGRHPAESSIWALSKKLENKGTLLDEHTGGRPKMNAGFGSEWDTVQPTNCNVTQCIYFAKCSTCFRRVLRQSSGAQKLYTQHQVLATRQRQEELELSSNSSTTATGSRQAWQVPDAVYTVFELLMMSGVPA